MSKKKEKKNKKARDIYSRAAIKKIRREDGLKPKRVYKFTMRAVVDCISHNYGSMQALKTYRQEDAVSYCQLGERVKNTAIYLLDHGFKPGDKIAIMGESSPLWTILYFGITSVGMTAVPILPDFGERDVHNILSDSGALAVATSVKHYPKCSGIENMRYIRLDDLFEIPEEYCTDKKSFEAAPGVCLPLYRVPRTSRKLWDDNIPEEDDIASLIYTSGTTGKSKGVLLTHKNLVWNADVCTDIFFNAKAGMRMLSLLPMSHVYEFTTQQLLGLLCGCEIHYLGRPPAPSVLLPALKEVRPHTVMSVPLLIEKVYRSAVKPLFDENTKIKFWLRFAPTRKLICRIVGRKLKMTFGGKLKFFGLGGAPTDPVVERFLKDAKFPYAGGYGLTETSPMVCGHGPKDHHPGFIGKVIPGEEVKLRDVNKDGVGEILVKGPNVTVGYYNNPGLNKEVFTEDGFFCTGDLGMFDKRGRLGLRGRIKTMILGAGGENIYPENIESLLNDEHFVAESLVVPSDGGLMALIKLDMDTFMQERKLDVKESKQAAEEYIASLKKKINTELSSYSRLSNVELQDEPFQRTPTQKIKRFLYAKKRKDDR